MVRAVDSRRKMLAFLLFVLVADRYARRCTATGTKEEGAAGELEVKP
ncbi:hypothetical protein I3843_05G100900 [Carya illinoinensis]|uniref:Uncharacterized protein n=1 Tax=Carya illinoinensis TaxID=32201 RepID=A0A922FP91_CARIL|nr:hypothetical protein I3842_02G056200 [Carya illinoinensis]KAG7978820.1 hypothetical protein I3843_05G100900 [Carya illinoinensis]